MIFFAFQFLLQVLQHTEAVAHEFSYPPLLDLVQRHRVQAVQLFPTLPYDRDKVCVFELLQVLCHRLACHVHMRAECRQRLAFVTVQLVKQTPAAWVSQRFG